jgi:hypothetical protein
MMKTSRKQRMMEATKITMMEKILAMIKLMKILIA